MPERIQLRRAKGWRKPPNTVVVARPTKWGNPYRIGRGGVVSNDDAVEQFRAWLDRMEACETVRAEIVRQLRGKNLACWCALDQPCHADVLLEIANAD